MKLQSSKTSEETGDRTLNIQSLVNASEIHMNPSTTQSWFLGIC